MRLTVNGSTTDVADDVTVAALVERLAGERRGVAVAVNSEVVPQGRWDEARLTAGDAVEVLVAAQGG